MIGQLTNHLWQSTLFALAVALLTLAFRGNRAKVRYSLWWIASLKFLIPFSVLIGLGSQFQWTPAAQQLAARAPSPVVLLTIEQFSEPFVSGAPAAPRTPYPHLDWRLLAIAGIWLCGFLSVLCLRCRAWRRVRAVVQRSVPLNIPLPAETRLSSGILEPGIVGFWRPILLLPEGIIERLTPSEFEAVVAHELCHIRRRDNLLASIHMVVEALFWFHPLVWWIGARLVEERERACDEHVVSLGSQPEVYADAILNVCKLYAESLLACVSGVTGADIRRRIEAIMSDRGAAGLNRAKKTLLACAAVAAVVGPVVIGVLIGIGHVRPMLAQRPVPVPSSVEQQTVLAAQEQPVKAATQQPPAATRPRFDAASIRPCQPGDGPGRGGSGDMGANRGVDPSMPEGVGGYFRASPGRLDITCGSIMTMVDFAYVGHGSPLLNNPAGPMHEAEAIAGIPKWALAARYTIHAVTDDPVANGPTQNAPGQRGPQPPAALLLYGPMLQGLLEDRFQLKIHRTVEEAPMYALTAAKGGFKLKPIQEGDCTPLERGQGMKRIGVNDKPYCGWVGWPINGPNRTLLGGGISLDRLARSLSELVVARNVINRTGIDGSFIIRLEYAPDENTRPCVGPAETCAVDATSDIPPGPTIFAAIERQLGLKLEPIKGPRERIVIDSVQRPSEN